MNTWTTPVNNTGRILNGTKVLAFHALVYRTAAVFGMSVSAAQTPVGLDPVNIDALRVELDHLVKSAKRGAREGAAAKFVNLASRGGVTVVNGLVSVLAPAGLAASGITDASANLTWSAVDVPLYTGEVYDIEIREDDGGAEALVASGNDLNVLTFSATGLTPETDYFAIVRVQWFDGSVKHSSFSARVLFTTLP